MGKAIDLPAILSERAKKEGRASGVLEVHCVNEKDTRPGRPHLKIWISGAKIRCWRQFFGSDNRQSPPLPRCTPSKYADCPTCPAEHLPHSIDCPKHHFFQPYIFRKASPATPQILKIGRPRRRGILDGDSTFATASNEAFYSQNERTRFTNMITIDQLKDMLEREQALRRFL